MPTVKKIEEVEDEAARAAAEEADRVRRATYNVHHRSAAEPTATGLPKPPEGVWAPGLGLDPVGLIVATPGTGVTRMSTAEAEYEVDSDTGKATKRVPKIELDPWTGVPVKRDA